MSRITEALDIVFHPRCQTRRSNVRLVTMIVVGTVLACLIVFIVNRWWVSPLAILIGLTLMTHPVCLFTHYTHKERR